MGIYTNLKSDGYHFFHSPLWLMHLLIPVIGCGVFLWYDTFSAWDEGTKLSAYIQMLAITFPVLIGIIMAIVSETEEKAGGCQLMRAWPGKKYVPHISKLLVMVFFGLFAAVIALVGFGLGFMAMGHEKLDIWFYMKTAVLLWISMLPLYLLHYILSFIGGKGYSIGLGIVGSLVTALLLTGLGDGIWWLLPWGIAARFPESLLVSGSLGINFLQYSGILQGILFIFSYILIFMVVFILLFKQWEGRKSED